MVSNTLSERNSNMSRDESLALTRILLRRAREDGIWMRGLHF